MVIWMVRTIQGDTQSILSSTKVALTMRRSSLLESRKVVSLGHSYRTSAKDVRFNKAQVDVKQCYCSDMQLFTRVFSACSTSSLLPIV